MGDIYDEREAGLLMIKSMTGFGRCEKVTEQYKVSVEMKAVNHRYLDLSIKMPKKFNYFEAGRISVQYSFDSTIRVNICDDLYISFSDIAELLNI